MLGDQWVVAWQNALAAAERRGADCRLEIDRPATSAEVVEVEASIGRALPVQFRRTLLEFSRRVNFFWFLRKGDRPPAPLNHVFCGDCDWNIDCLARWDEDVRWLSEHAFAGDTDDERLWRESFAFHSIPSGDYLAIHTRSGEPQPVVYLSHELYFSHGYLLGANFFDFMDRWTAIGCPDDDIWPHFFPEKDRHIDLEHPNVVLWTDWFGLPRPRGGRAIEPTNLS